MEDHQRFLQPYQKDATNYKLNFKNRHREVKNAPIPVVIKPNLTGVINKTDEFFGGELPIEVPKEKPIIYGGGDFFDYTEKVVEDQYGNFFV